MSGRHFKEQSESRRLEFHRDLLFEHSKDWTFLRVEEFKSGATITFSLKILKKIPKFQEVLSSSKIPELKKKVR